MEILTGTIRYLVTELLGTDLNRLLTSKPLDGKFVQYFTYQLLVNILGLCCILLMLMKTSGD